MATTTTEDMLAEIRRHIDELEARPRNGTTETRARLQHRFDRLREEEAAAWAAVREKVETVDEKVRQLEIDISIAENRLASEIAALRQARSRAVERLTALHASSNKWQEQRNRVTEALDDLERKVREAALRFQSGGENDN